GGSGSLWGTLFGGIVLGVAQNIGAQIRPQGFLIGGHVVFLVILVARVYFSGGVLNFLHLIRKRTV
ncbi:MAG: branched-chain amino acid ABC transporter permease, partial [Rhodoferax sp.]